MKKVPLKPDSRIAAMCKVLRKFERKPEFKQWLPFAQFKAALVANKIVGER